MVVFIRNNVVISIQDKFVSLIVHSLPKFLLKIPENEPEFQCPQCDLMLENKYLHQ